MDIYYILSIVLTWQNLLAIVIGGFAGLFGGHTTWNWSIRWHGPGLPYRHEHGPGNRINFYGTMYRVSNYGGSITAIMLNTPGDASNAATILDGFPMCEKGESNVALGISATGAMVGGIFGIIVLIFFHPS